MWVPKTNTAHWRLLPCFRGAPRSGEGYKTLALRALKNTAAVGAPLGCPKKQPLAKGWHKTCPYSAQTPRGCHFEQSEPTVDARRGKSEKSQTFHFHLSTFNFNCIPCGCPKQIQRAKQTPREHRAGTKKWRSCDRHSHL